MTPGPRVTLFGKPDCHLCDDAREALEGLRGELGFELVERDISGDERLMAAYGERIPVVMVGDDEVAELFIDEDRLRDALARVPRG